MSETMNRRVVCTEADLERLYAIYLRLGGLAELTTPEIGGCDIGHHTITRSHIHSLLAPISSELGALYCELSNLAGGMDRDGSTGGKE